MNAFLMAAGFCGVIFCVLLGIGGVALMSEGHLWGGLLSFASVWAAFGIMNAVSSSNDASDKS